MFTTLYPEDLGNPCDEVAYQWRRTWKAPLAGEKFCMNQSGSEEDCQKMCARLEEERLQKLAEEATTGSSGIGIYLGLVWTCVCCFLFSVLCVFWRKPRNAGEKSGTAPVVVMDEVVEAPGVEAPSGDCLMTPRARRAAARLRRHGGSQLGDIREQGDQ